MVPCIYLFHNIVIKNKPCGGAPMKIYEIEDLCEILKIGKSTAYQLVRNQEIQSFKLHGIWKITEDALLKYLQDTLNKS